MILTYELCRLALSLFLILTSPKDYRVPPHIIFRMTYAGRSENMEGIGDMLGGGARARENLISILSFDLLIPHAAGDGPQDGGRGGAG